MTRSHFFSASRAGLVIGAVFLSAMAGCADTPSWGGWSTRPTYGQLQRVRGIQADWVYYPAYETYYSSNYQEYVYRYTYAPDYSEWVTRLEPLAPVTAEKLQASPSVSMQFQDDPARHHADVARTYPKNWSKSGAVLASNRGE